jgi:hypothetical protein
MLVFKKIIRSSSISIFWGRLSSWVKIRLHTKNQLPRVSGSALTVVVGGVVWGEVVGGPTDYFVTLNLSWGWVEAVTISNRASRSFSLYKIDKSFGKSATVLVIFKTIQVVCLCDYPILSYPHVYFPEIQHLQPCLLSRGKCPVSAGSQSAKLLPVPHLARCSQIRGPQVTDVNSVNWQTLDNYV